MFWFSCCSIIHYLNIVYVYRLLFIEKENAVCMAAYGVLVYKYNVMLYYFRNASKIPAATAEPITPETFGPIACIKR